MVYTEKIENKEITKEDILDIYFFDAVNLVMNDLKKNNDIKNEIDIKLFLKTLSNINSNIIKFYSDKNSSSLAYTNFENGKALNININSAKIEKSYPESIIITITHELNHYIGLDLFDFNTRLIKEEDLTRTKFKGIPESNILDTKRELITKIKTFRYIMNLYKKDLSIKGIEETFKIRNNKNIQESKKREIDAMYEIYYLFEEDLLFYLKELVKLDELKKEVYYT